jgi:hypothetical protein
MDVLYCVMIHSWQIWQAEKFLTVQLVALRSRMAICNRLQDEAPWSRVFCPFCATNSTIIISESFLFSWLRAGRSGIWIPVGAKDFSLLRNVQTASGPTKGSVQEYRNSFLGRRDVNLTTRLHLVPRLSMSGVIPPLPLYAFTSWIGALYLYINVSDAHIAPDATTSFVWYMFRYYFLVYA